MRSKAQEIEILQKVKYCVEEFLKTGNTGKEIGENSNGYVSRSSVQRYLKDEESIREIFGLEANEIIEKINSKLQQNYEEGKSKGGKISTSNNIPTRGEGGRITGNKKR